MIHQFLCCHMYFEVCRSSFYLKTFVPKVRKKCSDKWTYVGNWGSLIYMQNSAQLHNWMHTIELCSHSWHSHEQVTSACPHFKCVAYVMSALTEMSSDVVFISNEKQNYLPSCFYTPVNWLWHTNIVLCILRTFIFK